MTNEQQDAQQDDRAETAAPLMFEGDHVGAYEGVIPRVTVECDTPYKRNTIVRAAVELRVKNVRYVEDKKGGLIRVVDFTINDVTVVSSFDPAALRENVGGSLSGSAPDPEAAPDLAGLDVAFGTTGGAWPDGVAAAVP